MNAGCESTAEVTVKSPLGLHGRPAARIVKMASAYNADLKLTNVESGEVGDCRSILSLLVLAATEGAHLILSGVGEDAEAAISEISRYFDSGFNEQ